MIHARPPGGGGVSSRRGPGLPLVSWVARFANRRGTSGTENGLTHACFTATAKELGKNRNDIEVAFTALPDTFPMKVAEVTFKMPSRLK